MLGIGGIMEGINLFKQIIDLFKQMFDNNKNSIDSLDNKNKNALYEANDRFNKGDNVGSLNEDDLRKLHTATTALAQHVAPDGNVPQDIQQFLSQIVGEANKRGLDLNPKVSATQTEDTYVASRDNTNLQPPVNRPLTDGFNT